MTFSTLPILKIDSSLQNVTELKERRCSDQPVLLSSEGVQESHSIVA